MALAGEGKTPHIKVRTPCRWMRSRDDDRDMEATMNVVIGMKVKWKTEDFEY